jgi:Flp pilus assembly protein TadG
MASLRTQSSSGLNLLGAEDGAAMVEFALAAAVFMTILIGILEFGFAAWAKNSVAADAREGARFAMVRGIESLRVTDSAGVATYVKSKTSLDNSIQVVTTWTPDKHAGSVVAVKVRHAVARRGPFLPAHTDSATSTMIVIF